MSANTAQRNSHWWLAALLFVQIVLMSANARQQGGEQTVLTTWLMSVFTPVASGVDWALSGIIGSVNSYTDLRGAREENLLLKEQNEELAGQLNEAKERASELDLLRAHLALPSRPDYRAISANVVARDADLWYRRLTIDRGTLDGVKRNMPVATAVGIVGRVVAVGPNFAQVQVITDKHAGVGAALQNSRAMGEVRGMEQEGPLCELQNVPSSETVEVGETIITTGLDRIYPKGLMIGKVERIESNPNAPWHKIIVSPSARVDRVEHVLVLLVEQKDLKVEETAR
ncbi:MAG TPA: rod shape-determining protein MreC [Blastocatellia bacterium]|nr:rod shape-determining protein MreC [Blastocatellia bacterium]